MSNNDGLKEELESIKNQLDSIQNIILANQSIGIRESWKQYIFSYYTLYVSIFISALIGVLSNWLIALWYLPNDGLQSNSFLVGGLLGALGTFFIVLLYFMEKGKKEYDKVFK